MSATSIKDQARRLLAKGNIAFTKRTTFDRLVHKEQDFLRYQSFLEFARGLNSDYVKQALEFLPSSKGEIFQDVFAALCIDRQGPGFFVEFGATDGVSGSNTWMLEKHLGWNGILAEPGRGWHSSLARNRNCTIEPDCVWVATGDSLEFTQARDAGFSTISAYAGKDRHSRHRANGQTYFVKTVSLHDMLTRANAPRSIDYISIDTEGSEFDILSHFPFGNWDISVLTIEHNFREDRAAIHDLLTANGFVRVLTAQSRFDDWYVASRLLPRVEAVFTTPA
jgi:FkbM family methyltransferase